MVTPRFRASLTNGRRVPSIMIGGKETRSMWLTNVLLPITSTLDLVRFNLRACEIPRSVSKTVNNFFHYGLHLRPKKKATRAAEMMSVELVAIFWVVNASSGEKSCLQFSMPTGSGAGGGGGVSHSLKAMWNTFSACLTCSAEGAIKAISLAFHRVSHRLNTHPCESHERPEIPRTVKVGR